MDANAIANAIAIGLAGAVIGYIIGYFNADKYGRTAHIHDHANARPYVHFHEYAGYTVEHPYTDADTYVYGDADANQHSNTNADEHADTKPDRDSG